MKKLLFVLFASLLVLGACGNDDSSNDNPDTKSENKTEKKSEDKKDNKSKDDKKSKEEKKSQENEDNKSTQENNSTEEQDTQENATNEQVQSQQSNTQRSDWEINRANQLKNDPNSNYSNEWTEEQQAHAEYETKKSGHPGMADDVTVPDNSHQSSNTNYDPNNPYMNLPDQEWRNNAGGLSSGEIQTRNEILNGTYEGEDAQQILDAINYYEEKYSN